MKINSSQQDIVIKANQLEDIYFGQIFSTHGTSGDMPSELSREDIHSLVVVAANNIVDQSMFQDHEKVFGKGVVRNYWFAFITPELETNIRNIEGFTDAKDYPVNLETTSKIPQEIGCIGNLRFIIHPHLKPYSYKSSQHKTVHRIIVHPVPPYEFQDYIAGNGMKSLWLANRIDLLCTIIPKE